jgi:hypothetical protein
MKHVFLVATFIAASALSAVAQPVTSYRLAIYNVGGATPITSFDFPAAQVDCAQPFVTVTGTQLNASQVRWQNPANAALDCVWNDPGTGPLFALPFSTTLTYNVGLRATNLAGFSAESIRSNPFQRPGSVLAAPALPRVSSGS